MVQLFMACNSDPGNLKFLRHGSGNTRHSAGEFIEQLKKQIPGLIEVFDVEECDVILAFCPAVCHRTQILMEEVQGLSGIQLQGETLISKYSQQNIF